MTAEEVVVEVKETAEHASNALQNTWAFSTMKSLLLASVGAVAMTYDEMEKFTKKLVDRGELAQKEAEKILSELRGRFTPATPEEGAEVPAAPAVHVETVAEELLNRLNIPSKRDIDELSAQIAQLSARVEELRKAQDGK